MNYKPQILTCSGCGAKQTMWNIQYADKFVKHIIKDPNNENEFMVKCLNCYDYLASSPNYKG